MTNETISESNDNGMKQWEKTFINHVMTEHNYRMERVRNAIARFESILPIYNDEIRIAEHTNEILNDDQRNDIRQFIDDFNKSSDKIKKIVFDKNTLIAIATVMWNHIEKNHMGIRVYIKTEESAIYVESNNNNKEMI